MLKPELAQRVVDLRLGITNAPASVVNNERAHLLELFVAYDTYVAEVARLQADNARLAVELEKAKAEDTELLAQ